MALEYCRVLQEVHEMRDHRGRCAAELGCSSLLRRRAVRVLVRDGATIQLLVTPNCRNALGIWINVMQLSAMYFVILALAAGGTSAPRGRRHGTAPELVQGFLAGLIQHLRRKSVDK
jgi:hypothetical protein